MGETPKTALPPQDRAASLSHNIKNSLDLLPTAPKALLRSCFSHQSYVYISNTNAITPKSTRISFLLFR
ncbi:hypothetical protein [Moorena sp. SIO4G3]|uniref:hypothetical protein n=1 Tax=Moorena sp. SIO4G3 TaxID=2607821 RepID=UPI00142B964D|nr:hypothetical protein [Moorena sp. SIO4G3]NEO76035.1 hypothetical protein [Moorena sp. SIO4G3]